MDKTETVTQCNGTKIDFIRLQLIRKASNYPFAAKILEAASKAITTLWAAVASVGAWSQAPFLQSYPPSPG